MGDNTILLSMDLDLDLRRTSRVLKARGSSRDGRRHDLTIARSGIQVD